ncbi:hypothetical protein HPP92_023049 [Vanilla planifolia]|uniref:Uncharacterized protein n=1 Tax=Vanilla planifolia TaxID=51239 RepID=A0A835PUQ2_VANPL|nr:hypothetical protein HPP92_023049 [Vanilla planifolia]
MAGMKESKDFADKNADGRITEEEVKEIISLSASANKLSKIQDQAEEYARLIMEELDPNNVGYIEIYNLETLLLQAPSQSVQMGTTNSRNLSQMLSQKLKPTAEPNPVRRYYKRAKYFLEDNWKRVWLMTLWLGICAGLFAWKFVQYRERAVYHVMGYCVCAAKGGAETLKFNMALILLPVCRNTITWLRNKTKLGVVVPFDDNLNFHKVIAVGIALGVGTHAISHLTCDFPRLLHATDEEYVPMKPFFGDTRPNNYWWFVKGPRVDRNRHGGARGHCLHVGHTMVPPRTAQPPRTLEAAHRIQRLLVLPPPFRRRLCPPHHPWHLPLPQQEVVQENDLDVPRRSNAAIRVGEAHQVVRSSIRAVKILKVAVYPGNVLALHVSKPNGFRYRSGQYIFVNCAAVSPFEWHPFSITSAPQDDYVSVHIRTLGDWTRQLKVVFSEVCQRPTNGKSGLLRAEFDEDDDGRIPRPSFPKVLIDGPYGAPAQDYKKYDVVLLVGLGIGATPFISVVKDIVNNMRMMEEEGGADDIEGGGGDDRSRGSTASRAFRTRRAYFTG